MLFRQNVYPVRDKNLTKQVPSEWADQIQTTKKGGGKKDESANSEQ